MMKGYKKLQHQHTAMQFQIVTMSGPCPIDVCIAVLDFGRGKASTVAIKAV